MKFIIGKKLGMTQIFATDGMVIPVTIVKAGPCQVVQVKLPEKEKVGAVQISFAAGEEKNIKKPQAGHLRDLKLAKILRDFEIGEKEKTLQRGDIVSVETFVSGDKVEVCGYSKGKGFAGVVKRHHFRGGPASHGHKDNLRAPGSIGAGGVQRVFKGMRMAGRMGGDRVTVKNLEIVQIVPEKDELYIKGAVPGGRNSILLIKGNGELKIKENIEAKKEAQPVEMPAQEIPATIEKPE